MRQVEADLLLTSPLYGISFDLHGAFAFFFNRGRVIPSKGIILGSAWPGAGSPDFWSPVEGAD